MTDENTTPNDIEGGPGLADVDKELISHLTGLGNRYGALGVARVARKLWLREQIARPEGWLGPDTTRHQAVQWNTGAVQPLTYAVSAEREVLLFGDGDGTCHELTDPHWDPMHLSYIHRRTLSARLRAIADVIDDPQGEH